MDQGLGYVVAFFCNALYLSIWNSGTCISVIFIFLAEMANKISFDLQRIAFFGVMCDVDTGSSFKCRLTLAFSGHRYSSSHSNDHLVHLDPMTGSYIL